jgi:hypothetical protein
MPGWKLMPGGKAIGHLREFSHAAGASKWASSRGRASPLFPVASRSTSTACVGLFSCCRISDKSATLTVCRTSL